MRLGVQIQVRGRLNLQSADKGLIRTAMPSATATETTQPAIDMPAGVHGREGLQGM